MQLTRRPGLRSRANVHPRAGQPRRLRLLCEELEDRCVPASGPIVDSWLRATPGLFAEVISGYNVNAGAVTTWPTGATGAYNGGVSTPTLSDITRISYSSSWVYVQAADLAGYVMGPWFLDANDTQVFPNFPSNQSLIARFSVNPQQATTHSATSLGSIGMMVNGVSLFNMLDSFSWSNSQQRDNAGQGGQGYWNRDANFAEKVSFDHSHAHQPQSGEYHYHSDPTGLRAQLGDNIAYTGTTDFFPHDEVEEHSASESHDFPYEEDTTNLHHSPILGWSYDGYPIYGPYGYSDPTDSSSPVVRMESSFRLRNITQRTALPGWAAQKMFGENVSLNANGEYTLSSSLYGPSVSTQNPLGKYAEDYEFVSGLGTLDKYNGRFTVTPEFPNGTYAYFITIDSDGEDAFPYSIGPQYYGTKTGGTVTSISESVTVAFDVSNVVSAGITLTQSGGSTNVTEGGPADTFTVVLTAAPTGDVTISFSSTSQINVAPSSVIFTSSTWSSAQTISVTAVDDTTAQGNRSVNISESVTSGDSRYQGFSLVPITVGITDDEGTSISGTSGADRITVTPTTDLSRILVTVNGKTTTYSATVTALIIDAGDGNDTIQINNPIVPITVLAGSGTDKLLVYGASTTANIISLDGTILTVNNKSITTQDLESLTVNGGKLGDTFAVVQIPAQLPVELKGDLGTDRLFGPTDMNTWIISGSNTGTLNGIIKFSAIEGLTGGAGIDMFSFALSASVTSSIDGGDGADVMDFALKSAVLTFDVQNSKATATGGFANVETLIGGKGSDKVIGPNAASTWHITGANQFDLGGALFLQSVENLTAGTADDTFVLGAGGSLKGKIDGGAGSDSLDYSGYGASVTVSLSTLKATGLGSFANMESSFGGSTIDTLQGPNRIDTWTLTGADAGTLKYGTTFVSITFAFTAFDKLLGGSTTDTLVADNSDHTWNVTGVGIGTLDNLAFQGMENLTGGTGADSFVFAAGKSVRGKIDGGTGTDTLDFSAFITSVYVNLQTGKATGMSSFANIESFLAGTGLADTLTAPNASNAWSLTGPGAGSISNANGAWNFAGFENLTGGTLDDTFTLDASGDWTGLLNGGMGIDSLIASSSVSNTWTGTTAGTLNGRRYTSIETRI